MEGPFDKYLGPWDKMRPYTDIDDRTDDPYPWHDLGAKAKIGTPTVMQAAYSILDSGLIPRPIPPLTRLGIEAGGHDVANRMTPEEINKFIDYIRGLNTEQK